MARLKRNDDELKRGSEMKFVRYLVFSGGNLGSPASGMVIRKIVAVNLQ